jgi:hypothetical protein
MYQDAFCLGLVSREETIQKAIVSCRYDGGDRVEERGCVCLYEIRPFNSLSFTYLRIHVPDAPGRRAGGHQSGAQSRRLSGDSLAVLTLLIPLRMIRHQSIAYKTNRVSTRSANDVVTIDGAEFNARQISPIRTVQTFFHWL